MSDHKYQKAKFSDVVKYSFGGLGSNLAYFIIMSYLTFFYTDIFGISSITVATLMLVARFIDAFTDPIMGVIGDRTISKFGKFRPWIIFGAPVLGFLIFLLFTAPNLSATMKVVYAYVVYIAYSLASTVVNIPYHALTPVMSEDPVQRTAIVTWKQGMGTVSQFIITIFTLPLVEVFGGGATGWAIYGALIGVLTTVSFFICAWGGKDYDKCDLRDKQNIKKDSLGKDIALLFKNKPMMMLTIAFGTDVLANATCSAVNVYYFKYVLGREDLVPTVAAVILWTGVIVIPLLPLMSKIFGKKRLYYLGSALSIIPLAVMWIRPTAPVMILMISMGVFGFVSKFPNMLGWAMLPECSDFAEWKWGKRADGLMSSALTFFNKFGMAVGGFIASFFLGIVGYVPNVEQTSAVLNMIAFLRFGMPILGFVASMISMLFYEINDKKYAEIRSDLDKRHVQKRNDE